MDDDFSTEKSNGGGNGGGMVELAPFYQTRVQAFFDMFEPCSMEDAEEYFDDIKLRDFFGCQTREFTTDGLPAYREELINLGYKEYPCPWLHHILCFPVKNRWAEVEEIEK